MNGNKLVSYCILTYNQEKYIKSCLESVLSQTYQNLEIIISDDNSTDGTWAIIEDTLREYKGPHVVKSFRNNQNLGLSRHYSKVTYEIVSGEYIIFLGGDDICSREHVEVAMRYVDEFPDIMLFDFNGVIVDEEGCFVKNIDISPKLKKYQLTDYLEMNSVNSFAPGRIFNRRLVDIFAPIDANCPTEDSVMVLRSLLTGGFLRVDENLIKYRIHSNNVSSAAGLKKMNNEAIINQYLTDVNLLFSKGDLKIDIYQRILFRIIFELKFRNLIKETSDIKRRIKRRSYIILYKLLRCI